MKAHNNVATEYLLLGNYLKANEYFALCFEKKNLVLLENIKDLIDSTKKGKVVNV